MKNLVNELRLKMGSKRSYLKDEVSVLLRKIIIHRNLNTENKSDLLLIKQKIDKISFEYWNKNANNEEAFVLIDYYVKKALDIIG